MVDAATGVKRVGLSGYVICNEPTVHRVISSVF